MLSKKGGNKDIKVLFELHPKRDQIDQRAANVLLATAANPTLTLYSMWFPEYMISISYVLYKWGTSCSPNITELQNQPKTEYTNLNVYERVLGEFRTQKRKGPQKNFCKTRPKVFETLRYV